ncbi:MAG TPA: LEA type 2 family protein [Daejeonella sp.]|uniref:LEA type 2 family protein n=1 Tax=Daejeonella sp. TaxID=2805397 RepID=UPI002EDA664A
MKKILLISFIALIAAGCGVSRKINLLEQCRYDIKSADSVYVAGRNITRQIQSGTFDLGSVPELAIGLLRKDIPLRAKINLGIENPGSKPIEINQFDYIISFKGQELVNGTTDRRIDINPAETTVVPIMVRANIYSILSDKSTREEIFSYLRGTENVQKSLISIKIRPSIRVGNKLIKYPGYITIDKELSSSMFK